MAPAGYTGWLANIDQTMVIILATVLVWTIAWLKYLLSQHRKLVLRKIKTLIDQYTLKEQPKMLPHQLSSSLLENSQPLQLFTFLAARKNMHVPPGLFLCPSSPSCAPLVEACSLLPWCSKIKTGYAAPALIRDQTSASIRGHTFSEGGHKHAHQCQGLLRIQPKLKNYLCVCCGCWNYQVKCARGMTRLHELYKLSVILNNSISNMEVLLYVPTTKLGTPLYFQLAPIENILLLM